MRHHDSLGVAGGPRGVDNIGEVDVDRVVIRRRAGVISDEGIPCDGIIEQSSITLPGL